MRHLILFTSQFPFGHGETFIESELPFLEQAFDRILIVTNDIISTPPRSIPEKVEVIRISGRVPFQYKLKALAYFFTPVIQNERQFIKNRLKLSAMPPVLSAMFGGYAQALHTADLIEDIMANHALSPQSVVLYSYWMSNTATGIALYKQKTPGVKTVCRAHGWDLYFERHTPPYLPLRKYTLNGLDYCCCISANGKQYLENLLPENKKNNIVVSRLGTFNKTARRSKGNSAKLIIVSCSGIISLKRIHLIIEALALIGNINIEWTHFGSGPLEEAIKKTAHAKLGPMGNIKYQFVGQVSNAELLEYYAANPIDLFINLSETEGLPVSFMEAGSYGIPVIATNVGGVGEIIRQGENGFLVEASAEPMKVAEKIETYYSLQVADKLCMRDKAFAIWQKDYNAEKNYKSFTGLIK